MAIRAVIFDADGVVIHPWRFANFLETIGITHQMTQSFYQGIFEECLVGKRDLKSVLPPYLEKWGWEGSVDAFVEQWLRVENAPDERMLTFIRALSDKGFICGLATSQEKNRAAYIREVMGFASLFDPLFFSCDIGYTKEEAAFYEHATHVLGLQPHEILFWDDSPSNVQAARQFGWQAEVYYSFDQFDQDMQRWLCHS